MYQLINNFLRKLQIYLIVNMMLLGRINSDEIVESNKQISDFQR